jgi:7-cyano-7-deazaguanine synthase
MTSKAVVVLSGGLDSSTLLHYEAAQSLEVFGISFNYGQRHSKELQFACKQVMSLYPEDHEEHHKIVDMSFIRDLFKDSGSSLVTDTDVPEGHYGEESMKATIVPNRNMIMLSIATGYAVSIGAERIATGVHAGDHFIYPDCRPDFIYTMGDAIRQATDDVALHIDTPFLHRSKNQIAQMAFDLRVDIANTWSCYQGGDIHCGKCGTCVERLEAIASTGNEDPTPYADDSFYLEALKRSTV